MTTVKISTHEVDVFGITGIFFFVFIVYMYMRIVFHQYKYSLANPNLLRLVGLC